MWCIYTMEYYLAIKKWWNFAICDNMDRSWEYYAKWNKSNGKGKGEEQYEQQMNNSMVITERERALRGGWKG